MIQANDRVRNRFKRGEKIHLVGAGGAGVGALMSLLSDMGFSVSGCDQLSGPWIEAARSRGIAIEVTSGTGRRPHDCRYIVHSAAIPMDHPELQAARQAGLRVTKYAEFVGLLMDDRDGVAVAGTHGKTSTSAWVSYLLEGAGLDPMSLIGGTAQHLPTGAKMGSGRPFVVEACEYDNSFHNLRPLHAAITNIEADHLDYFETEERLLDSFIEFVRGIRSGGTLVLGDPIPEKVIRNLPGDLRVMRIGPPELGSGEGLLSVHDLQSKNGQYEFRLDIEGQVTAPIHLAVPGKHNVKNAMIAAGLASVHDTPLHVIQERLSSFKGVGRRLEIVHDSPGLTLIEDYAHHPTEIEAAVDTLREVYPDRRLVVLFQPHQASRTAEFFSGFAHALSRFDLALLADIYAVRESSMASSVTSRDLAREVCAQDGLAYSVGAGENAIQETDSRLMDGDVCVVMGAGDINKATPSLLQKRSLLERRTVVQDCPLPRTVGGPLQNRTH